MSRLIFLWFFINLISCSDNQLTFIKANSKSNFQKVGLGNSNYYLQLPKNFKLSEARGKEGQLGYDIIPNDTASTMGGFIEIRHGDPIGGDNPFLNKSSKVFAKSYLAGKKVKWTITNTQRGTL